MGQMVEALGLSPTVTPAGMALFSVAQAAARVITGASSEMTLQKYGWPRTVYVVFAAVIGVLAHLMMGIATSEAAFVLGAALSGVNFGMIWPLLVLCVGEIFGASHVGANYLFYDGFASGAGTFLLSKIVAQSVYEHHINPATAPDPYTCIGADCFRMTHYVTALCCLTCVASSYAFVVLTKDVYQPLPMPSDNRTALREEESEEEEESFSDEPDEDDIEMDFGMG
jgi:MFS family permease